MDLIKNKDGFVDLYFGPEPPKGKEKNWVKTAFPERAGSAYCAFMARNKHFSTTPGSRVISKESSEISLDEATHDSGKRFSPICSADPGYRRWLLTT